MSVILPLIGGNLGGAWTPPIEQSVIFDGAAYQSWTPGVASTSRRIGSLAMWYRRAEFGVNDRLFSSRLDSSNYLLVEFQSDNTMRVNITISGASYIWVTNAVYRDIGWQHMLMTWNTTTQTFALLHNGVARTFSSSATLPLNGDTAIFHNGARQTLGAWYDGVGHSEIFHGAIADVHGVDGTALANADTFLDGVTFDGQTLPAPKAVSGLTYGTNGFHLAFANSAAFGDDTSGNGNDWTPTGFVAGDQTADVPGRPYAVWNPLDAYAAGVYVSNGGLRMGVGTGVGYVQARATLPLPPSGKWYWEVTFTSNGASPEATIGIASTAETLALNTNTAGEVRAVATATGNDFDGSTSTAYGAAISAGSVVSFAADMDAGTIKVAVGGQYANGSGSWNQTYSAGASAFTDLLSSGKTWFPWSYNVQSFADVNFGQTAFAYTPPSGFLPLSTDNLPTPLYAGKNWQDVLPWSGNATNARNVTGAAFTPDFMMGKARNQVSSWYWADAVRGLGTGDSFRVLDSTGTAAEYTTEDDQVRAFINGGFTVDSNSPDDTFYVNRSGDTYAALLMKANGAGVANTDGTISSTVSVAAPGHFAIVGTTGNGVSGASIGHGMGGVPDLIIGKRRTTAADNWRIWHKDFGTTGNLGFNTAAKDTVPYISPTVPTSTLFYVQNDTSVNAVSNNYIFYLFRSIPGLCKVGSYTGNGSADGPLIDLGFTARWIMIKSATQSSSPWYIYDTARQTINVMSEDLLANSSAAEPGSGGGAAIDILSSAVKHRSNRLYLNNSGSTYIYLALAELAGGGDLPWPLAR